MGNRDNYRLELNTEKREKFKRACHLRRTTMADAIRNFIDNYIRETYEIQSKENKNRDAYTS